MQFVFSRVQEHQHLRTKKGLVPLRGCLNSRSKKKCKHGFPKRTNLRCVVVCAGNYKRLGVRISGRRNSLGSVVGRRSQEYQSGTIRSLALLLVGVVIVQEWLRAGVRAADAPLGVRESRAASQPSCATATGSASRSGCAATTGAGTTGAGTTGAATTGAAIVADLTEPAQAKTCCNR